MRKAVPTIRTRFPMTTAITTTTTTDTPTRHKKYLKLIIYGGRREGRREGKRE